MVPSIQADKWKQGCKSAQSLAKLALQRRPLNAFTDGNVSAVLLAEDWNFLPLSAAAISFLPLSTYWGKVSSCSWAFSGEQWVSTDPWAELVVEEGLIYVGAQRCCRETCSFQRFLARQGDSRHSWGRDVAGDGDEVERNEERGEQTLELWEVSTDQEFGAKWTLIACFFSLLPKNKRGKFIYNFWALSALWNTAHCPSACSRFCLLSPELVEWSFAHPISPCHLASLPSLCSCTAYSFYCQFPLINKVVFSKSFKHPPRFVILWFSTFDESGPQIATAKR